jgi:hypothetical protein
MLLGIPGSLKMQHYVTRGTCFDARNFLRNECARPPERNRTDILLQPLGCFLEPRLWPTCGVEV